MPDNADGADAGAEGSPSDRLLSRSPVVLHLAMRIGLGVLGLAMLAAAVLSLRRDNELGTVAVCLVGAAMVLVGAMGRWPTRISWGDRSAEWAEEILERVVESGSDQTRAEIVQAALEARNVFSHWVWDNNAIAIGEATSALLRAIPDGVVLEPEVMTDGVRADLVIRPDRSADRAQTIAVEVSAKAAKELYEQAHRFLAIGYGAVLIMIPLRIPDSMEQLSGGGQSVFTASFRDPPAKLQATVREVIDYVERSDTPS